MGSTTNQRPLKTHPRFVFENGHGCNILPYPRPEGVDEEVECFIVLSWKRQTNDFGESEIENHYVSYVARRADTAAEWMPPYGPIMLWFRAEKEGPGCKRAEHIFPLVQDRPGSWSQLAVTREGLIDYLAAAELDPIFRTLADWSNRRD